MHETYDHSFSFSWQLFWTTISSIWEQKDYAFYWKFKQIELKKFSREKSIWHLQFEQTIQRPIQGKRCCNIFNIKNLKLKDLKSKYNYGFQSLIFKQKVHKKYMYFWKTIFKCSQSFGKMGNFISPTTPTACCLLKHPSITYL